MTLRIYLRRSKGDEHQHFSLEVQREGVRQLLPYLRQLGIPAEWDSRVEYVDDDRSRSDFEGREALAKLRRDVQEGDIVACRDQSRIGGDALEVTVVVRDIVQRRRGRLFYYTRREEVRYESVMDAVRTFVEGVGSQMEVENIRSRTREALRARVARGQVAGGRCFGYRNVRRDNFTAAVVDEEQAKVVRHVFGLAHAGWGFKAIAGELNASGLTTGRGGSWTAGAVRALLRNARYRGVLIHGRVNRVRSGDRRVAHRAAPEEIVVVEVPEWRIVDDVTWYSVQARFKAREQGPRPRPATKYALSGIARCGHCGGAVGAASRTIVSIDGVQSRVPAYSCLNHRVKGGCPVATAQRIDEVHDAVAGYVQAHVLTPAVVDQLLAGVRDEVVRQTGGPKSNVRDMERRLDRLKVEQRNLARALATGGDGIPELVEEMRGRQRRIEELKITIESARRTPAMVTDLLDKIDTVVRQKLAHVRTALADDPAGAREVYAALFPDGLAFEPTEVSSTKNRRIRKVWSISGTASLGVCNLVVTPPGFEPGISA